MITIPLLILFTGKEMHGAPIKKLRLLILCIYYNCNHNISKDYFSFIVRFLCFAVTFCIVFTIFCLLLEKRIYAMPDKHHALPAEILKSCRAIIDSFMIS
jgi:hypothetical protein